MAGNQKLPSWVAGAACSTKGSRETSLGSKSYLSMFVTTCPCCWRSPKGSSLASLWGGQRQRKVSLGPSEFTLLRSTEVPGPTLSSHLLKSFNVLDHISSCNKCEINPRLFQTKCTRPWLGKTTNLTFLLGSSVGYFAQMFQQENERHTHLLGSVTKHERFVGHGKTHKSWTCDQISKMSDRNGNIIKLSAIVHETVIYTCT